MEEIFFDPYKVQMSNEELATLQEIMNRSKTDGPQIGIPWNKKVYDYMFESGVMVDPSILFGDEYFLMDMDEDYL